MPPLWQYFSRLLEADEPIAPPKGVDPWTRKVEARICAPKKAALGRGPPLFAPVC
jgi:hypothetical protein